MSENTLSTRKWPLLLAAGAGAVFLSLRIRRAKRRMSFEGASVVITGGSRGLGLEMARLFAQEGARLTLLSRKENELERAVRDLAAFDADVLVHPCDVRVRNQVDRAVDFIIEKRGRIDVLVNNAGVVEVSPFENLDLQDFENDLAVHAWGPLFMIRAAVPHMIRQGGGRIVNISSVAGLVAVPHLASYTMSKSALVGLSDSLRAELSKDGIVSTTVAPGLMRTGSHVNARYKGQHKKEFAWFAASEGIPLFSVSARRAAGKIVEACRYGDPILIIGYQARLLHLANTLFPGLIASLMALAGRLLPAPAPSNGNKRYTGWESRSDAAPSFLTRLADEAISRNNEGNGHVSGE
ncbi:MAG TPA: SDR family oxidoreductase [Dissulfurispiraceae bacterium]